MNNKLLTGLIIAAITVAGVCIVSLTQSDSSRQAQTPTEGSSSQEAENRTTNEPAASSDPQATNAVTYKDFKVEPRTLTVKKGTTVTWTNEDTARHDVTPETETDEFKASALFGKGESYEVTFNTVGSFDYICSPHPYMKGTIEVIE